MASSALPDGWTQHKDKWNRAFYYNATTGASRWQPPQGNLPYTPQMVEALPPGWVGHRDSSSGRMYYVDTSSGVSQWTFPVVTDKLPPSWQRHKDPISSRNYYYNTETKESRWTVPTPDVRQKTPEKNETSPEKAWVASKHSDSPATEITNPEPTVPSSSTNTTLFGAVQEPMKVTVVHNNASASSSSHITADDYTPASIKKSSPEGKAKVLTDTAHIYNTNTTAVAIAAASTTASAETKNEEHLTPSAIRPLSDLTVRPVSDLTFLAPAEEELPAGWKSLVDPSSGKSYYYSSFTGKTQWSRPLIPAVPPPPAITPSTPGLPTGKVLQPHPTIT